MANNRIGIRLTPFEREAIDLLIKQKAYANITDFTRKAIQNQLKAEGMDPAKAELERNPKRREAIKFLNRFSMDEAPQETEGSGDQ